jgi:hypothetical protein
LGQTVFIGVGSPVTDRKPGERNAEPAPDTLGSERQVDLTFELVGEEAANDLHPIARPL